VSTLKTIPATVGWPPAAPFPALLSGGEVRVGIGLIVEVLTRAPGDLGPSERMVLVVLAEDARDATRESWALNPEELGRRAGLKPAALQKVFQRLAKIGLEVRVPLKVGKDGRPVYAYEGKKCTYRLPLLKRQELVPPSEDGTESALSNQDEEAETARSEQEGGAGSDLSTPEGGTESHEGGIQSGLFGSEGGTGSSEGGTGSAPTPHYPSGSSSPSEKKRGGAGGDAKRRKPETTAPEIFPVSVDMHAWAAGHTRQITVNLDHETERFLNHARQHDRRCRDWHAAWRNWVLKAQDFADQRSAPAATGTDGRYARGSGSELPPRDSYDPKKFI
jgi:hypothetical protein